MYKTLLIALLTALPCTAQSGSPRETAPVAPAMQNLPQMEVGRNDLLNVRVYDSPELSGTVRVGSDGRLQMPMLGKDRTLNAAGLLPQQIAAEISAELEHSQLIVHPMVTVEVAEYQSRTVTVGGAVRHPITFQAYGRVTLLEAISRAEGLSDSAGDEILVSAIGENAQTRLSSRFSMASLMSRDNRDGEFLLHGGEEIRIPEQGKISILGDVKHPGVFSIKNAEDSSLLTLLARSEGVTPNARNEAYIYRLSSPGQPRSEVPVNLKYLLEGRGPDVRLEPGDILYVPDNHSRRVTLTVLEHLSTLGAATATALLYSGLR